jgi:hypothetical protein
MRRYAVLALVLMGCAKPTPTATFPSPERFIGEWSSITPGREFIGLTISSLSVRPGGLGARLTFSGVAWEGSGSIDQDAFRATMSVSTTSSYVKLLVVRSAAPDTLRAEFGDGSSSEDLTLIRAK